MDIDLLSKMVKELILDNDEVVLPGLGAFVAEVVPSTFSDKGFTINPPYRKLYFRNRPDEGRALIDFYASSNNINVEVADKVLRDFIAELKSVLLVRKTIVFPGLGRLRATKENAIFFVADEDLDIYPEGFGLESVSLKTHVESREEVAEAVAELKAIVVEPASDSQPCVDSGSTDDCQTAEVDNTVELIEESEDVVNPAEQDLVAESDVRNESVKPVAPVKKRRKGRGCLMALWIVPTIIILLAAVLLAAFVAVSRISPELLDPILYTPEELEILNHK